MSDDNTIAWVGIVLGCAVLLNAVLAEGQAAPDWTEREILIARLCANEGTWGIPDAEAIAYARQTWTVTRGAG
jgi:hypothetical protein